MTEKIKKTITSRISINILSYVLAALILYVIYKVIDVDKLKLLLYLKYENIIVLIIIALIILSISGTTYLFVRKKYNISFKKSEIIKLPILMNFWGTVIPFQGSMIFSSLYFKVKYNLKILDTIAINVYLFLITMFLAGFLGILYSIYNYNIPAVFPVISVIFVLNPVYVYILHLIGKKVSIKKSNYVIKIFIYTRNIFEQIKDLWKDYKTTIFMLGLNILRICIVLIWYFIISFYLGFKVPVISLILLTLWNDLSLILKFTPQNLGISQIVSGSLFLFIGLDPDKAVLISLVTSSVILIIAFTFGIIFNLILLKEIGLNKFKIVIKSLITKNSNL